MIETFNHADGRRVVAADTAEELGTVKGFVVDQGARRVEALHVSGKGDGAEVVAWDDVQAFGTDAVMVEAASALHQVSGQHATEMVRGHIAMHGSRILNTDGFEEGIVEEVYFETETGALTRVKTGSGEVVGERLRAVGSYALIVDPERMTGT